MIKETNALEKFSNSIINAFTALILSLPFYYKWGAGTVWKTAWIILFFCYHLLCAFMPGKRDLGMLLLKTYWLKEPSLLRYTFYNFLYTISFSTLLFYIWFPLDLYLANMLFVQLPMILITKNTLHGYIAQIRTIKNPQKR